MANDVMDPTSRLVSSVNEIFGSACRAAWLSGSFAYGGAAKGRSDIDIVIVLDEAAPIPADAALLSKTMRFVDEYLLAHRDAALSPDLDFPGEYITGTLIEESIAGRGFDCLAGRLALPAVTSPEYWLEDSKRWFRAWLSMTAFSSYLCGDRAFFESCKREAWKALLKFLLVKRGGRKLSVDDVLSDDLSALGVKASYKDFENLERVWVAAALAELATENFVVSNGDGFTPVLGMLEQWERETCRYAARPADTDPLFLNEDQTKRVSEYAKANWVGRISV